MVEQWIDYLSQHLKGEGNKVFFPAADFQSEAAGALETSGGREGQSRPPLLSSKWHGIHVLLSSFVGGVQRARRICMGIKSQ